ncbi:MAG: hypothetical protein O3C62_03955 [Actinomycetota bacterium]|nr:hypothetical protein [Actinomycetota bacterium]MDA2971035.1 hypothetical protein [Actinomycetota bacterium]MDA3000819.1 hypothetical protein [Actinomycetota bacterium]
MNWNAFRRTAGFASIGAGALHAMAVGMHTANPSLARVFGALAILQVGGGLALILRPNRVGSIATITINTMAFAGWAVVQTSGISWLPGLESRESPQIADSITALLALMAAVLCAILPSDSPAEESNPRFRSTAWSLGAITLLVAAGFWNGSTHRHGDDHSAGTDSASHDHNDSADASNLASLADASTTDAHLESDHHSSAESSDNADHSTGGHATLAWPRPFDPAADLDISGVAGVTPEQEDRARELIALTQTELPRWSDYETAVSQGWVSIGDESTGFEHLINRELIVDDRFLDPTAPESLVYQVEGQTRTLVSAMFMAEPGLPVDDQKLLDFAGPLMQWHVHDNLCFRTNPDGRSVVAGVFDSNGNCPQGSAPGGFGIAMVHVWIAPHPCGPFAALEGEGAGRAAVSDDERVDMCAHSHSEVSGDSVDLASLRDSGDPRIDLSGFEGVSDDEQRRAEDLVYLTRKVLPIFSDPAVAEAAGFTSIGDGGSGYEHYINWTYINDDFELDPLRPESLVYRVESGSSTKTLVSAMYMLGDEYTLDTVPNVGGKLTQWHIHNNLCFDRDPMIHGSARVVGVTSENGPCIRGIKLHENPMIHVWLTPHPCGPFAALEGVGAGQIVAGEERLCDDVHSGH